MREKIKKRISVYTDFDRTITKIDIGDELFREFGRIEPYLTMLKNDEIDIKDYWITMFENLEKGITVEQLKEFAANVEVDPYFKPFAEWLREEEIPLAVISDGFDIYINTVLELRGLDWLPVYSNKMIFTAGGEPQPHFPGATESCECKCASCKRNAILTNTPDDQIIVFIGDGYSDFCAAEHADVIFAKKDLQKYCYQNNLPHYDFQNFFDVKRLLEKSIKEKTIKKRHQAYLKRKKAFETE